MTDFLETTVDKFTFRVATDRLYSRDGLWVLPLEGAGGRVRVGLADYVQQHSGDTVFVTVRPAGTRLKPGDDFVDFETIKIVITLSSPVGGTIAAVNAALQAKPELVNQSPYDEGWLAEIDVGDWEVQRRTLLAPDAYLAIMRAEAEGEARKP